jgi:tetratricopeptide (TPR) repeat protein
LEEAWNLNASGRQDEIVKNLRAALETAGARRDETIAQLLLQLARREAEVGETEAALAHALDARAIFEEREDVRGLATATRVVGGVYYRLRRLDEARDVLRRGLALAERVGSVEEIGFNLINLGMVELRRGALDEAIACDRRAIEEFERVGRQTSLANAYANLAEKLMHHEDYDEALGMCEKAIEIARGIGYSLWEGDATQTKAAIELRLERLAEAEAHAVEAASIFERIGAKPRVAEALTLAAEASAKAGEMERARDYASRAR